MNGRLEFLTKHFLVLSAAITCAGAAISMVFVTGYLSVFDKSIVWIIEYPDLIKFTLLGLAVISASASFFIGFIQDGLSILSSKGKYKYFTISIIIVGLIFLFGYAAYNDYKSGNNDKAFANFVYGVTAIFVIFATLIIVQILGMIKTGASIGIDYALTQSGFILFVIFSVGACYGHSIKNCNERLHEFYIKDKSNFETKFSGAKIIMILSHHSIFQHEKNVIIIPTSDVVRVESHSK